MSHIHLDPGHFGSAYNHGLNGYVESNFTWTFTNLLKTELEGYGFTVTLSRQNKDDNPGLVERGSTKADCFISIHSNAASRESADYPVAFYGKNTSETGLKMAQSIVDMIHTTMGTAELGRITKKLNDDGEDYYGVLRGATRIGTPIALIIEHSFHTNDKASKWLLNDANVKAMVKAEAKIIYEYLGANSGSDSGSTTSNLNPMNYTNEQFIELVAAAVKKYAPKYGISVYSPVIAQACLESGYGKSNKAKYYNFFGLKYREGRLTCHSGKFTDTSAEQNSDGSYTQITTDWYMFNSIEAGVEGYFQYTNIARYNNLKGVTDPHQYLVNIKADGYATSLTYVDNVYKTLTNNNLTRFDNTEPDKVCIYFQAGAYSIQSNATNMLAKLKKLNVSAIIYKEGDLYKIGITDKSSESILKANKISYFKKVTTVTAV